MGDDGRPELDRGDGLDASDRAAIASEATAVTVRRVGTVLFVIAFVGAAAWAVLTYAQWDLFADQDGGFGSSENWTADVLTLLSYFSVLLLSAVVAGIACLCWVASDWLMLRAGETLATDGGQPPIAEATE